MAIKFGCPPGKGYNYKDLADILKQYTRVHGPNELRLHTFERTQYGSYRHPLFKTVRNYE